MLDIIIPTLNEGEYIASTLQNVFSNVSDVRNITVWISDCASLDNTLLEASKFPVNIIDYRIPPASRSSAMNLGADSSSGDTLLFLHADVKLPLNYDRLIFEALAEPQTIAGAFEFALDGPDFGIPWLGLRWVEFVNRNRYRLTGLYYGDQAIFSTRTAFEQAGKFPDVNIMEDSQFCRRVRQIGRMKLIPEYVFSSSRRFLGHGYLNYCHVCYFDLGCSLLDTFGISCERYAEYYKKNNRDRGRKIMGIDPEIDNEESNKARGYYDRIVLKECVKRIPRLSAQIGRVVSFYRSRYPNGIQNVSEIFFNRNQETKPKSG